MKIFHSVLSLDPESGGPARTVPSLARHAERLRPDWNFTITTRSPIELVKRAAAEEVILHDHGVWMPINHASAVAARRGGFPRIISPRGMLSPWALSHKRLKKAVAWRLYAKRDLEQADVLHATSELELRELRELGVKQPIAVIPNGVEVAPSLDEGVVEPERPYLLFLSRVHRKKGVRELLDVWRSIGRDDWDLVIAGPDEEGYLRKTDLPRGVRYVGMIDHQPKWDLMRQAGAFVLPSYSENFGVVVAESLMAGVPVITTHGTPWHSLESERCGWWIPMTQHALRDALVDAMNTSPLDLRAMGLRGREFAVANFGWGAIAHKMCDVYNWMLNGGAAPECVCESGAFLANGLAANHPGDRLFGSKRPSRRFAAPSRKEDPAGVVD